MLRIRINGFWPLFYLYRWGVVDVEDCRSGADHLAKKGEVDKDRVCIDGGSAGGYTTLACIAFTDAFKAGHYLSYI